MKPSQLPIAQELFEQWRQARGGRQSVATRPFSRDWEDLMEAAGLVSAVQRREAEHDIRELAALGWVTLREAAYRAHQLERVAMPLAQEEHWCSAFGYVRPTDEEARIVREFAWEPALAFLRAVRTELPLRDLQALNTWIAQNPETPFEVPIKERSLEIFGDEKRLDDLAGSVLFGSEKLTLKRLGCFISFEPLAWKRGPNSAAKRPILVLENAATWHSYDRWNSAHGAFSALVYGGGNRFRDSVYFLEEIFRELGGPRPIYYFGDLDGAGLRIPRIASERAHAAELPRVEPHLWSYRQLLEMNLSDPRRANSSEEIEVIEADLAWLGELKESAARLLRSGRRLAQEAIGWRHLQGQQPPVA